LRKANLSVRLSVCYTIKLVIRAYVVHDIEMHFEPHDKAMYFSFFFDVLNLGVHPKRVR